MDTKKQDLENVKLVHFFYHTKLHFLNQTASVDCISRVQLTSPQTLLYPCFPLRDIEDMVVPDNLSEDEKRLLKTLQIEEDEINQIERETRYQPESHKWREECKFRFTASTFHLTSKRQKSN